MKYTQILSIAIFCLFVSIGTFGQSIRKGDLEGLWKSNNQDSLYYKSDTIRFHLDINRWNSVETCNLISWQIKKNRFRIIHSQICTEPGKQSWLNVKESLRLKKKDFGQIIELKQSGEVLDKFKIIAFSKEDIDRYPHTVKELTLLRFDKLEEEKLYNYVDSLAYHVLKYKPSPHDSSFYKKIIGNAAATASEIRIRDSNKTNPKPLLVINGVPIESYEILKAFLFIEATSIDYISAITAPHLHGFRARNGVILVSLSNNKFKMTWRKYNKYQKDHQFN